MTPSEYPPEREYDLKALASLDEEKRNPVILQLNEDVTGRLRSKIESMIGKGREEEVEELMQEMWSRLIPRLAGNEPLHGIVGFMLNMQAHIVQEHCRRLGSPRPQHDTEVLHDHTPSRVVGSKQVQKEVMRALEGFRSNLDEAAVSPPPDARADSPVLQLLALDNLVSEGGHSQVLLRERGLSQQEASRLRRNALDRLSSSLGTVKRALGVDPEVDEEPGALNREVLARGSLFADAWDLLGVACHRHPPAPFATAHPGHAADVQWLRKAHSARCETCATQEVGTAADGERAIATVTRSLGL